VRVGNGVAVSVGAGVKVRVGKGVSVAADLRGGVSVVWVSAVWVAVALADPIAAPTVALGGTGGVRDRGAAPRATASSNPSRMTTIAPTNQTCREMPAEGVCPNTALL
jgi:hypothetical protein